MIRRRTKKSHAQATNQKNHNPIDSAVGEQLTFLEHLYELRSRLFWVVTSLIITSAIGFQYKDFLVSFVMAPLDGQKLVYLTPGGGFSFIFTVCLYFGALVTIPVVMYHIYRFLQPVLGKTSRRFIAAILILSVTLAAGGAIFGYMVAIPAAIHFLSTFAGDAVTPNLTAESYLSFIVTYMLGLAALFQLPLLLYIVDTVKKFPPGTLLTSQRFVVVGAVIAAAIITPTPDVINQLIVAGPIIAVYQLGAVAIFIRHKVASRRNKRGTRRAVTAEAAPVTAPSEPAPALVAPRDDSPVRQEQPAQALAEQLETASGPLKQPVARRSLDGFAPRATVRPPSLAVPSRDARENMPVARPMRSIDGIIV